MNETVLEEMRSRQKDRPLDYGNSVFVNCPFDDDYAPILQVILFGIIRAGMNPRLAVERLENGENRLEKIIELMLSCKYSVHDLSLAIAKDPGEMFRMNMPFEFGLDYGLRKANAKVRDKQFLIFERTKYDLKRCLSDIAGLDVEHHDHDFNKVIEKLRNFLIAQAGVDLPAPSRIQGDYVTFQGWMTEKKIYQGFSAQEALRIVTRERLHEMKSWCALGRPAAFDPSV